MYQGRSQGIIIGVEDPRADDLRALLATHLAFSRAATPAEYSFALDVDGLVEPAVTFFAARRNGELLGIGALKRLDQQHAEIKSMHTREAARGEGVATAMVEHLLHFARAQGYRRVSLETGTTDEFAPARALYRRAGFAACAPFGGYRASPYNTCMTKTLDEPGLDEPGRSRGAARRNSRDESGRSREAGSLPTT